MTEIIPVAFGLAAAFFIVVAILSSELRAMMAVLTCLCGVSAYAQFADSRDEADWLANGKPVFEAITQAEFTAHCGASGAIDNSPGVDRNCFDRGNLRVWVITGTDAAVTYYVGEKQPSGQVKKTMFFNPNDILRHGSHADQWLAPDADMNEYRNIFTKSL